MASKFSIWFVALLFALISSNVASTVVDVTSGEELSKFELWTGCGSVKFTLGLLGEPNIISKTTKKRLETAIRSRLRGARIYSEDNPDLIFYVAISVMPFKVGKEGEEKILSTAFTLEASTMVRVSRNKIGLESWASASRINHQWGVRSDINNDGYIDLAVASITDRFIDDYMRVNAETCKTKGDLTPSGYKEVQMPNGDVLQFPVDMPDDEMGKHIWEFLKMPRSEEE